jgi:hypothetical protein
MSGLVIVGVVTPILVTVVTAVRGSLGLTLGLPCSEGHVIEVGDVVMAFVAVQRHYNYRVRTGISEWPDNGA